MMTRPPPRPPRRPVISAWVIAAAAIGQPDGARYLNPRARPRRHRPGAADHARHVDDAGAWQAQAGTAPRRPPFLTALAPGNHLLRGLRARQPQRCSAFSDRSTGSTAARSPTRSSAGYTRPRRRPADRAHPQGRMDHLAPTRAGAPILIAPRSTGRPGSTVWAPPSVHRRPRASFTGVTWDRRPAASTRPPTRPTSAAGCASPWGGHGRGCAGRADPRTGDGRRRAGPIPPRSRRICWRRSRPTCCARQRRPGGQETVLRKLHDAAFSRSAGGYRWSSCLWNRPTPATPAQRPGPPRRRRRGWPSSTRTRPCSTGNPAWLDTMQQELANLWWKAGRIPFAPGPSGEPQRSGFDTAK